MENKQEKLCRLADVARRYYLEDCTQSEIAKALGVSRPLMSRMLSEARKLGVVTITVQEPRSDSRSLLDQLCQKSGIRDGVLVEDGASNNGTNRLLAEGIVRLLKQLRSRCLGVGWGYLIGQLVTCLQQEPQKDSTITDVCPLIGSASIPARNYQSNEIVRLMAEQFGAVPHFLYLPALPENLEEKQVLCSTEVYHQIMEQWKRIDTAVVNIGDYPSSPDFASLVRYGSLLQQEHACGRLLIYYVSAQGTVIRSDRDFAVQIPLEILKQCPNIIGVCSANTTVSAFRGALRTGIFSHIVARSELARAALASAGE